MVRYSPHSGGETVWGDDALLIASPNPSKTSPPNWSFFDRGKAIEFIDDAAKQDIPIDVIKKQLHVA